MAAWHPGSATGGRIPQPKADALVLCELPAGQTRLLLYLGKHQWHCYEKNGVFSEWQKVISFTVWPKRKEPKI